MSALRQKGLKVDDPLGADRPSPPVASSAPPQPPVSQEWREWSVADRATSFRFPPELIAELAAASEQTGVSQGRIVTVALTLLLDEGVDAIVAGADRAERALAAGRRRARKGMR